LAPLPQSPDQHLARLREVRRLRLNWLQALGRRAACEVGDHELNLI
jgi:hypothetical protein